MTERTGPAYHQVVDPRTGDVIEHVELLDPGGVPAVAGTAAAVRASWADTPVEVRCRLVARLADAVERLAPESAREYSREHGKTVPEAAAELSRAVETIRWAAQAGPLLLRATGLPERPGLARRVEVEPVGPVLAIVPWNFPAVVLARKLAPALVAGCPVVVKAPEETPRVASVFARAAVEGGLPEGVVQVVFAAPAQTEALVRRPEFRHVTFTGSTRVGRIVAAAAAPNLTECTLELGGHAPAIVTADADLDLSVTSLAAAKFGSAGQSCAAPSRFLVHRSRYDEFVERFLAEVPPLDCEDTRSDRPPMGPLNNARRRAEVHALVLDAVARGARLRAGGVLPTTPGYHYPGTVVVDVPLDARILHEEPFGPVAATLPYDDEEQAVAIANDNAYALTAYVFGDTAAALRLGRRINAGSVAVNSAPGAAPDAPLGGRDASGFGYEGGDRGLYAFCRLKVLQHRGAGTVASPNRVQPPDPR